MRTTGVASSAHIDHSIHHTKPILFNFRLFPLLRTPFLRCDLCVVTHLPSFDLVGTMQCPFCETKPCANTINEGIERKKRYSGHVISYLFLECNKLPIAWIPQFLSREFCPIKINGFKLLNSLRSQKRRFSFVMLCLLCALL
jgi:hypothetical protein